MTRGAEWLAILSLGIAAPALAQQVVLTEDSGRPLIVGDGAGLGAGLESTRLAPQAIVAEFQRICLSDPAGAPGRIANSALALEPSDAVIPAAGKRMEATVAQWRGTSALVSVWTGDDQNLKGRPIAITSRAYSTTGAYGPFRADGVQCNLVVSVADFAAVRPLSDALTAAFGAPGKLVAKKTFADGYWQVAGATPPVRINFTAPTTRSGPQPVHLSAQVLKERKR